MASVTLRWNVAKFRAALADRVERGMTKAVIFAENEAKKSVNRGQKTRVQKTGKHAGRRVGLDPSQPGEPPKKLEAQLINSISHAVERAGADIVGFVGVRKDSPAAPYARRLELGFVGTDKAGRVINQGERPYLRPAVFGHKDTILKIIAKG